MKKVLLSCILALISSAWTWMAALCMPSLAPESDANVSISGTLRFVSYPCEDDEPCPDCLTLGLMTENQLYYLSSKDESVSTQLEELEEQLWEAYQLPATVSGIPYTIGSSQYISVTDVTLKSNDTDPDPLPNETGVEEVKTPSDSPSRGEKVLHDGQMYILRNNRLYNLQGQMVRLALFL